LAKRFPERIGILIGGRSSGRTGLEFPDQATGFVKEGAPGSETAMLRLNYKEKKRLKTI